MLYMKTHKKVIIHFHCDVFFLPFLLKMYVFSHDAKLSHQLNSTNYLRFNLHCLHMSRYPWDLDVIRFSAFSDIRIFNYKNYAINLLSILFNYYESNLHRIKCKLIFSVMTYLLLRCHLCRGCRIWVCMGDFWGYALTIVCKLSWRTNLFPTHHKRQAPD